MIAELLPALCAAHRYAVVTDEHVRDLYGYAVTRQLTAAGFRADLFSFPPGEGQKTRAMWAGLTDQMLAAGLGRDSAVIAVGGGVTGDLAGFVAATYMRGIPVVQVPTSLLAMIDASVGGKTGVDTSHGKNLVGAFWQPRLVLVDPQVLRTLPDEHLRAGLAEALKHAAIRNRDYFDWIVSAAPRLLAREMQELTGLISRSVRIKAGIVAADEQERGRRKILNFGHTIAHALELVSGYELLHGEAVAIGMVAAADVGEALRVTERGTAAQLRSALSALHLPTSLPGGTDARAVLDATGLDKKARGGAAEYVLLSRIGKVSRANGAWSRPVEDEVVLEVLARPAW